MVIIKKIIIFDSTLRDGNHAVKHQLNKDCIALYSRLANEANIPVVIVGHGNGLGASSLQVGQALLSDVEMIQTARANLKHSKLGAFIIPGFGTINRDLKPAINNGVDIVCVAAHCTETDTTFRHVEYAKNRGKECYVVLLMTHLISADELLKESKKAESYGVDGVIIMDSSGHYLPKDVIQRISHLKSGLNIKVGFHAHNNLSLAVANSIAAVDAGADIIDCCMKGFGAGAGNAQLEILVAVFSKLGYETGIDLFKILDASIIAEKEFIKHTPNIEPLNIVSGLAGVFSGFVKHVERISMQYGVDPRMVFFELGKRKVVAGQEDVIMEVAMELASKRSNNAKN